MLINESENSTKEYEEQRKVYKKMPRLKKRNHKVHKLKIGNVEKPL